MKAKFTMLEGNVLLTEWNAETLTIDEVKEIMEHMLVLMRQNKVKLYIDDISQCKVDWKEADKWIVGDWYERALALGVVKNALILAPPENMSHVDDQCEIRSFKSLEDALVWIHEPVPTGWLQRLLGPLRKLWKP